jgi:methyl-accepting chemotaxis protein
VRDVDLPILQGLDQVVARLKEDLARQVEQDRAQASARLQLTVMQLLGVAVLVMVVIAVVGSAIARALWRTLGAEPAVAASIALTLAQGKLDAPIPPAAPGSLLAALAQTQRQLREVLLRIRNDADRLSGAAQTLAGMSARLEESTGEQTQSASTVASSVQQMTVGIDQVSTHSGQALTISRQSGQWSDDGNQAARRAMGEMERIAGSASDLSAIVEGLGSRSEEIGRIVHVIQEIAGQTNLLALNAAIEAARAGEQGRGFSVVADEVRKLAERTTESTQEISAMIAAIQSGTAEAVSFVTQWSAQVAGGLEQVRAARDTLQRVKQGADQVVDAVNQISTTLAEQQSASISIAQSVDRIARMSQENAGAVSQLAQASRDLEQLSGGLRATIAHFQVGQ